MHPSMNPVEFLWGILVLIGVLAVMRRFLMWFLGIDRLHALLEDVVRVGQGLPPLEVGKPPFWRGALHRFKWRR